jgi:transposase InsO family protein
MDDKNQNAMAMLRFGLIAPVINETFKEATKSAYYQEVCAKALTLPDGSRVSYSPSTLRYWESIYRKGGFQALLSKPRTDKGYPRKLDNEAIEAIGALKRTYPKISATMVYEKLIEDGVIACKDVSLATVQRFIRTRASRLEGHQAIKDRRAFEAERVCELWQADTLYGPYVGQGADRARSYLISIIDDKSRLHVGGRFFSADNAYNFQKVLKGAVLSFGIPEKIYVDNGAPYKNDQLAGICGQLGSVLIHAPARDGAAKGKIERFNRTCRLRFLDVLNNSAVSSLDALNDAFLTWVNTYNTTEHSAHGKRPMDIYRQEAASVRCPIDAEWAQACFMNTLTRKVRLDATVSIDKVSYDVPLQFISQKVLIHFDPEDMKTAHIVSENKSYPIHTTDKQANAKAARKKGAFKIDYAEKGDDGDVQSTLPA